MASPYSHHLQSAGPSKAIPQPDRVDAPRPIDYGKIAYRTYDLDPTDVQWIQLALRQLQSAVRRQPGIDSLDGVVHSDIQLVIDKLL